MNSLLQVRMQDLEDVKKEHLEDLKKTVQHFPRCDFPNLQRMASTGVPLVARIEWCRRERRQSRTQCEVEGWHAEEEGLRDALFERDGTVQHRDSPPNVFERYAMGLEDGRALIRLGWVDCIWHPAANWRYQLGGSESCSCSPIYRCDPLDRPSGFAFRAIHLRTGSTAHTPEEGGYGI